MENIYTIGTDPEVFLRKEGAGYVSAIPYTNGTKDDPEPLPSGGFVSYDNVALEFGIPPAVSHDEFIWNMKTTISDLIKYLPPEIEMVIVPSADFPRSELEHKDACRFGCDPDFNAWSNKQNVVVKGAAKNTLRSCGGHVHVRSVPKAGFEFLNNVRGKQMTVFAMDVCLGLVATVLDCSPDSIRRRQLYGKAGCYRTTPGGIEYRTLSNFWIKSPLLVKLVHMLTDEALKMVNTETITEVCMSLGGPKVIQQTISYGEAERAIIAVEHVLFKLFNDDTVDLFKLCFLEMENFSFKREWGIKEDASE